jgi:outer membrane protein OmpA-like peptidoglycan-associated protein
LEEIYLFLKQNQNVTLEIGGHTNGLPSHDYCDRLSSARAKAVRDYLISKGINETRLTFKGYGKRRRIATDATVEGRTKNQRVEIKILSVG